MTEKTEEHLEILLQALRPSGDVLEVGFSPVSTLIKSYPLRSHTILEHDPQNALKAKSLAVTLVEGPWRTTLPTLGLFDTIYFSISDQPVTAEDQEVAHKALKQGQELLSKIHEEIPELATLRYSDHDIEEFFEQVGRFNLRHASCFLSELKRDGQISDEQYEKVIGKYHLERIEPKKRTIKQIDPLFLFLQECLPLKWSAKTGQKKCENK